MKKISKGVFRQRVNIIHASSQLLFINFGLFIKASWVTLVLTNKNWFVTIKLLIALLIRKKTKNDFQKRILRKRMGSIINADFWIL